MKEYDLIVIGAGPGGYEAAFEAADLGMKTALVEKDSVGGTCLNRGCIPTKSLLHAAEILRAAREAAALGVAAGELDYDPAAMQRRKRDVVLQLRQGIEGTAKKKKIDLVRGEGTVTGEGRVAVRAAEGTETLAARNILLATGSRPAVPPIPGISLPNVMTSDGLLECDRKIGRLVIIGGGVIGAEFASLYSALGAHVTVIEAMPALLPNMDRELGQSLKMLFRKPSSRFRCPGRCWSCAVRITATMTPRITPSISASTVTYSVVTTPFRYCSQRSFSIKA